MEENGNIDLISPYDMAERYALYTNCSLFISGRAGTGKTTFLRKLQNIKSKYIVVVAPTGVAAINAGGVTIHSLFQFPLEFIIPTDSSYHQMFVNQKISRGKRDILITMETLVIDEISMVRPDILDAIDASLRFYRNKNDLPFGGVQLIMIGDLFQLSPVVIKGEDEQLMNTYYDGSYFFFAHVFEDFKPIFIEFNKIFRQTDAVFIDILNEVRENRLSEEGKVLLRSRYDPSFQNDDQDYHITLTTHNRIADKINMAHLKVLGGEERHFDAKIQGDFPINSYPTEICLTLKIGARVMFIRNDETPVKRYYNGKVGTVVEFKDEIIVVQCDDMVIDVSPIEWKNERYTVDSFSSAPKKEVIGVFIQFPLRLAWAITIHKSQGMTFDKVIIDAQSAFAFGQVYVALSRCRSLEGIVLSTPIHEDVFDNDPTVVHYMKSQSNFDVAKKSLPLAEKEYKKSILFSIFDFKNMVSRVENMITFIQNSKSFVDAGLLILETVYKEIVSMDEIAHKFHTQIGNLLDADNGFHLSLRLKKADTYFHPLLQNIIAILKKISVSSKRKKDASKIMEDLAWLQTETNQKITYLRAVCDLHPIQAYLQAKSSFQKGLLRSRFVFSSQNKEKVEKGYSIKITLAMFQQGLSPQEIAAKRHLTLSTIYSHFVDLVKKGTLTVTDIISAELVQQIADTITDHPDVTSTTEIRSLLKDEVDYGPIRLVKACFTGRSNGDKSTL